MLSFYNAKSWHYFSSRRLCLKSPNLDTNCVVGKNLAIAHFHLPTCSILLLATNRPLQYCGHRTFGLRAIDACPNIPDTLKHHSWLQPIEDLVHHNQCNGGFLLSISAWRGMPEERKERVASTGFSSFPVRQTPFPKLEREILHKEGQSYDPCWMRVAWLLFNVETQSAWICSLTRL